MEEPKVQDANNDPQSTDEKLNPISSSSSSSSSSSNSTEQLQQPESVEDEEELKRLLVPDVRDLPLIPPSAVESNFVPYFAPDFIKPGHDQYVYRHANGLCVIGLALAHLAFKDDGGVTAVDFNVGKSDRSGIKVTGKRKKNAQHFESNTALCKVCTKDTSYIVRCCVKGSLLEVNDRLITQPGLLNSAAEREGYIAIIMPKPADWLKAKSLLLGVDEYKKLRELF
ncbi:Protein Simiate like [Actinidia chinensis var. chinensis]|uniref:Protein Simiate like n=1 Tax=Actinidia chinensis var. chinensis TaxID=1590841 RepID=A0A2R6PZH1_ACTCC|nr:Protein Simiate like [Actinidia chinensis var. chinensis]